MPKADFEKVLAVNTTMWNMLPRGGQIYGETESRQPDQHLFRPGRQGFIYTLHYAASKMGVIYYLKPGARAGAVEYHRQPAPGIIESEMGIQRPRVGR